MVEAAARDQSLLLDMLLAAQDAHVFVAGLDAAQFSGSRLHQHAVIRCLEIIGEAAGRVSPQFQAAHPEIPWRKVIGMRHRLIHGYSEVDIDIVWSVLRDELLPLIAKLAPLIPPEDAPAA